MKKGIKIIFALTLISLFSESCQKYSDDSFISFQSTYQRLVGTSDPSAFANKWQITSYQINGTEHSHDFDSILTPKTLTEYSLQFEELSPGISQAGIEFFDNSGNQLIYNINHELLWQGGYDLNTSGSIHFISLDSCMFDHLFFKTNTISSNNTYWSIIELFQNNFHIHSGITDIYFKKM
jgi:hypothetical protein